MRTNLFAPWLVVALLAPACGGPNKDGIECVQDSNCSLTEGGQCIQAPSGRHWCAYPDPTCPSGMRYMDFDVGDGLAGMCVAEDSPDAAIADGGADASPTIDALPDAPWPDAAPGQWGTPEYVLNINTSNTWELQPSASADHLELYFARTLPGVENFDIYVTTRNSTTELWSLASKVDALADTGASESSPEVSPDKLELYVVIDNMIHRSTRSSTISAWTTPSLVFIGSGRSPALTGDGLTMYYIGSGYSVKKRVRTATTASWGVQQDVAIPGDPSYNSVSVSADELHLLLSSVVSSGIPEVVELSRDATSDPWGNLAEVPTLTDLNPPPRDCDFFVDANEMYCALGDGTDFDIFFVRRE